LLLGRFLRWVGCCPQRKEEERSRKGEDGAEDLEEGWEYVEDGPAEIIWKGNEIIVKKSRKKVRKGTESGVLAIKVIIRVCFFFVVLVFFQFFLDWNLFGL
jgi:hypothetical protein